jgi:hypothetical protein
MRSPSTSPSTSGATGYWSRRSAYPSTPNASITHTSNSRCEIAYEPTTHSTKMIGRMMGFGTISTLIRTFVSVNP